jgi:hypothetical protein
MNNVNNIKELRDIGVLSGILVAIFIFLFCVFLPVRTEKKVGLAIDIQNVLDLNTENILKVAEPLLINSPIQTSLSVYALSGTTDKIYACIIRITGVCGPVPVVFLYSHDQGAKYVGIAGTPVVFDNYASAGISFTQIQYWSKKIVKIIQENLNE